jgi:hypothetical protein
MSGAPELVALVENREMGRQNGRKSKAQPKSKWPAPHGLRR